MIQQSPRGGLRECGNWRTLREFCGHLGSWLAILFKYELISLDNPRKSRNHSKNLHLPRRPAEALSFIHQAAALQPRFFLDHLLPDSSR
jgi:hypothetical protein